MCHSSSALAVAVTMAATVAVAVAVAVVCAPAMRMRAVRRQKDHVAMAHATLGDDVIGEFLHIGASPLENCDFKTAVVIEVYVKRRLRKVVVLVEVSGKALRQFACLGIVDVDERCHAWPRSADLDGSLLQAGAREVADHLGAVGITARSHEAIKLRIKLVIDSDGNPLHGFLLFHVGTLARLAAIFPTRTRR